MHIYQCYHGPQVVGHMLHIILPFFSHAFWVVKSISSFVYGRGRNYPRGFGKHYNMGYYSY